MTSDLASAIRACQLCVLSEHRHKAVPAQLGERASVPLIAIMGEAPGAQEDETGLPFQGKAGRLLNVLLEEAGLSRDEVLILNRVRCRPPRNNLASYPEAVHQCNIWTKAELDYYDPAVVVLTGATSTKAIFGASATVGELRGQARRSGPDHDYGSRVWIPTYHPASTFYGKGKANRPLIVADLMLAKELLKLCDSSSELPSLDS